MMVLMVGKRERKSLGRTHAKRPVKTEVSWTQVPEKRRWQRQHSSTACLRAGDSWRRAGHGCGRRWSFLTGGLLAWCTVRYEDIQNISRRTRKGG